MARKPAQQEYPTYVWLTEYTPPMSEERVVRVCIGEVELHNLLWQSCNSDEKIVLFKTKADIIKRMKANGQYEFSGIKCTRVPFIHSI